MSNFTTAVPLDVTDVADGDGNYTESPEAFTDYNYTNRKLISFSKRLIHTDPLLVAVYKFTYYSYPFILFLGSTGNILAYLVFSRTRLRKISSIQYLSAVAIMDTGFLWTFFLTPLYGYYKVPIIVMDGMCQFMTFLNYVFTFLSIWYLAAMVVEKFIGVYWPLKKTTMCTPFRAKLVMSFMAVIAVACYSYVVYFFGPEKIKHILQCMPWKELMVHFHNLSKIDTFVVALLPYILIILLTTLIVVRGCEYYRISASIELWPRNLDESSSTGQTSRRVTSILFPIIIITVLSNSPVMALRTAMTWNTGDNPHLMKWNQLFYIFYIINFAIKFYVYMLFSRSFRRRTFALILSGYNRLKDTCNRKNSLYGDDPQRIHLESMSRSIQVRARLMQSDI